MNLNPSIICWNVRGLNNPVKRKAVREFVSSIKCNMVCLQETKLDVVDQYLMMQCIGPPFDGFAYLSAIDTRGGVLLAWDSTVLWVDNISLDTHGLTGLVHNKDGFEWWITVVYGPQGEELKMEFLDDLRTRRTGCPGPWMLLGDFNMILRALEKNNANINRRIMQAFRSFVDDLELKEVYMHGRHYTWSNERDSPTLTKIDRILVSVDWNMANPDCFLQELSSNISDHAPLHLSTNA